jgi:DNA-binding MarR family transcriptional regulator
MAMSPISSTIMILNEFRKLDPELPTQIALVLMLIAQKPGISFKELVQQTGLGKSSVSRHIAALSEQYGKGLVTFWEDPMDRRGKCAKLTSMGQNFVADVTRHFRRVKVEQAA